MKNKDFNKGIILTALGSFWWGVIGVIYFEYISFVGHTEVVLHRCIWTAVILVITTSYYSKWKIFFKIINNFKTLFISLIVDMPVEIITGLFKLAKYLCNLKSIISDLGFKI